MAPIVELRDVNKWFGAFHVLKDVTLEVAKGETVVVCGPSGSGKSTMIRCINRLEEHQGGRIVLAGLQRPAGQVAPGPVRPLHPDQGDAAIAPRYAEGRRAVGVAQARLAMAELRRLLADRRLSHARACPHRARHRIFRLGPPSCRRSRSWSSRSRAKRL